MLNPLYIAVDKVAGFKSSPGLERQLQALRQTDLVDYVRVAETKLAALHELWQSQQAAESNWTNRRTSRTLSKRAVRSCGGTRCLKRSRRPWAGAVTVQAGNCGRPNTRAPTPLRWASLPMHTLTRSASTCGLQRLAQRQPGEVAVVAREARLRIGLYLDLAVGEAIDGSATWSERNAYIS